MKRKIYSEYIINILEHMDKKLARGLCKISYSHIHCQLIQMEISVLHSCWLLASSKKKIMMQKIWPVDIYKCPHVSSCESFFARFWPIHAKSRYIFFFHRNLDYARSSIAAESIPKWEYHKGYANSKFICYLNSYIGFLCSLLCKCCKCSEFLVRRNRSNCDQ